MNTLYQSAINELRSRLQEIDDLRRAYYVLSWDQNTYMPPSGADGRARQMATIKKISHARIATPIWES